MLDYVLKFSVLPVVGWLGLLWLNSPVRALNDDIKKFKKAPEGCDPPVPWDPNFKNYETIEEKQRIAETPSEICLSSLRSIEMILRREELQLILNDSYSESDNEN